MAVSTLLNLITLSSIAILACSHGATPVTALSVDSHDLAARSADDNAGDNGGTGKVGLGWPLPINDTELAHFVTGNVGPIYTWSPWIPDVTNSLGLLGVPMLWGENQIAEFVNTVVEGYAHAVLGFNEPNEQGQSNLSPELAAQLWQQYIQPLQSQGYSLISPAPSNAASGVTWLQQFLADCNGCHFDGIAVHWYGTDPQAFITYMESIHATFGQPIWVTQYACQNFNSGAECSSDDVWNFMNVTKTWMDATDYIAHYFYYSVLGQMMTSDGYPNALGQFYIN